MTGPGWWYYFSAGSVMHGAVVASFALAAAAIVLLARRLHGSPWLPRLEAVMVATLAVFGAIIVAEDLLPAGQRHWLPLNICDITAVIAPVALATGWRPLRTLLHFSGLTLASLSFIFPSLDVGPAHFEFWLHFVGHAGIVGAALYDFCVRGYRPGWSDLQTAIALFTVYAVLLVAFNAHTGLNYSYLGSRSHPILDRFGPWPERVPVLMALAFGVMTFVTLASARLGAPRRYTAPAHVHAPRDLALAAPSRHAA